jgi:hypothetical protein
MKHPAKRLLPAAAATALLPVLGCTFDFLTRDRFLTFDFHGTTMTLTSNGTANSVELKPYVAADGVCSFNELFANRRAGVIYVVLDASGASSTNASDACAGGTEENLIWLKLDSAFQVQDAQSVPVESCRQNIHGQQGYRLSEKLLTMKFTRTTVGGTGADVRSGRQESTLTYDDDHPEIGLKVETQNAK